jgi:hypothetical protein
MQGNPSNVSDFLATRDSLTEPINRFNTGFTEFHEMSSTALVRLATSPISDDIMARYRSLVRDVTDFHWIEVRSQLNMNVLGLLYAVDKAAPAADAHESLADAKKNWNRLEPALHLHLQSLRERYRALPKP